MKAPVVLCVFLVGCVADPPSLGESEHALKDMPGNNCSEWECGSNSPLIPVSGDFWDIPEAVGRFNSSGYKLTFFGKRSGNNSFFSYTPKVENGALTATRGTVKLTSANDLIGLMWRLEKPNDNGAILRYEVVVTAVGSAPFVAKPNWFAIGATHAPMAATYRLKWRQFWDYWPGGDIAAPVSPPLYDVCGENPTDDGMADFNAVIYEGDQIDPLTIQVAGDNGLNDTVGCAGHALAKQHLAGYTKASATVLGWPIPSLGRRTAHLKAVTGDYLGLGLPFTYAGVNMLRRDGVAVYDVSGNSIGYRLDTTTRSVGIFNVKTLEARWNQYGATCLNTPRVDFRAESDNDDESFFPGGVTAMLPLWATADHPVPPPCTGTAADNIAGTYITTVNWGRIPIIPL